MHSAPWAFGWEALVAIGTLLLASATFILARSTRQLARETAVEVEAQWRPILVPVEGTIQVFMADLTELEEQIIERIPYQLVGGDEHATADMVRRRVKMNIRNIGRGPALEIMVSKLWEGWRPWTASSTDAGVIAPNDDYGLETEGFTDDEGRDVRLQYRDLTGRRYITEIRAFSFGGEVKVQVSLSDGYFDPEIPRPPMGDPLMSTLPGVRGRVRAAAGVLFPPLGMQAAPLWRRIPAAMSAMWLPRNATFTQRVRYGIGRGWGETHNREVPAHLPDRLGGVFLFGRRLKRSYAAFRRYRGSGIPPVGYYRDHR